MTFPPDGAVPPVIGGGAMGRLLRETDGSRTPLGDHRGWPPSLRSSASLVLNARGLAALCWGPQRWLLYNDAFGDALGDRHPRAFGRPMGEALPDIAPVLGPRVAQVLRTGEGCNVAHLRLAMRRHGRVEETVWACDLSPVQGEGADFAGVLLLATETTDLEKTDRLATALESARPGTFDWHIATGAVEIDARGREIFGFAPDGPVEVSEVFARLAPEDVDRVQAETMATIGLGVAFDAGDLDARIDVRYDVVHPGGARRVVRSSGIVIQGPDGERRMLGILQDVTDLERG